MEGQDTRPAGDHQILVVIQWRTAANLGGSLAERHGDDAGRVELLLVRSTDHAGAPANEAVDQAHEPAESSAGAKRFAQTKVAVEPAPPDNGRYGTFNR